MKYQKSSHATYDVRYHVVWITWEIWATWYFVASVWEINWEIILKYVENQWKEENEVIEIEL